MAEAAVLRPLPSRRTTDFTELTVTVTRNATITVDLEKQEITRPDGGVIKFDVDPFRKYCLINGFDDIGLTLRDKPKIDTFEEERRRSMPWLEKGTKAA